MKTLVSRREILKGGLVVGAGLTVGFSLPIRAVGQTPGVFAPNQWLRIDRDGVVRKVITGELSADTHVDGALAALRELRQSS